MAPTLFSRLRTYVSGEEPKPPAITSNVAIALLVLYTLIYVVPFYLSASTRPSPQLSRDAPSVIRARIRSVVTSCLLCSLSTFIILSSMAEGTPIKAIHLLGYFPIGIIEAVKTVALTAILFTGPLFEAGIVEGGWRDWIHLRGLDEIISGWIGWRNIIAGPITEEVLFRSASVPLLLLSETSNFTTIFLTPITFGLAHIHHFYEFRITHPHTPVIGALLRSLLQLTYTTLFGGYATFLYLRTGSLLSVILVHAFCNWMGFPRFWGRLSGPETIIGSDFGDGKKHDGELRSSGTPELSIMWTVAYYILLVIGAVSWWKLLWPLTESDLALTKFG
ncbi:hypothetical protein BP6252_01473 [Coleophoma cylindrospora]|uniref:intramembrane prenyl-peptidase Rce1 n=1 Tax=Coleophoma cylindrospora TaxID=1849047 RepID=A0A3D8STE5_9HELO|nr:hypothetical protein BP6252_01473 [Coleophoma cylindrospora]